MIQQARITASILLAACAGACEIAAAQGVFVPPRIAEQSAPPPAVNRAAAPVEGWAVVRSSVRADGSLDNIRVVATIPPGIDPAPTVEAVRRSRVAPATENGKAIDWHNFESVVLYRAPPRPADAASDFETRYQAVRALLEREPPLDLQAAAAMNRQLLEESALTMDELGLAVAQRAIIAVGQQDWQQAYDTIRLVTDPRVPALRGEDLFVALQLRMQLADRLGRIADALETHDRFVAGLAAGDQDPFARGAEAMRTRLANEQTLYMVGFIGEQPWRTRVSRRIFTLANIEGAIAGIDVECDRRRLRLEYRADVEWRLPEAWGACELFVVGEPGTSFRFFEFLAPAEPSQ